MSVWSGLKKRLLKIIFPEARTLLTLPDKPFPTNEYDVTPGENMFFPHVVSRAVTKTDHIVIISELSPGQKRINIIFAALMLIGIPLLVMSEIIGAIIAPCFFLLFGIFAVNMSLMGLHSRAVQSVRQRYRLQYIENAYRPLIEQG